MNSETSKAPFGLFFGAGSIVFLPMLYGALGFVFGLIAALCTAKGGPVDRGRRDRG